MKSASNLSINTIYGCTLLLNQQRTNSGSLKNNYIEAGMNCDFGPNALLTAGQDKE